MTPSQGARRSGSARRTYCETVSTAFFRSANRWIGRGWIRQNSGLGPGQTPEFWPIQLRSVSQGGPNCAPRRLHDAISGRKAVRLGSPDLL